MISVFFQIEGRRVDEGKWRLFRSENNRDREGNAATNFFCKLNTTEMCVVYFSREDPLFFTGGTSLMEAALWEMQTDATIELRLSS